MKFQQVWSNSFRFSDITSDSCYFRKPKPKHKHKPKPKPHPKPKHKPKPKPKPHPDCTPRGINQRKNALPLTDSLLNFVPRITPDAFLKS